MKAPIQQYKWLAMGAGVIFLIGEVIPAASYASMGYFSHEYMGSIILRLCSAILCTLLLCKERESTCDWISVAIIMLIVFLDIRFIYFSPVMIFILVAVTHLLKKSRNKMWLWVFALYTVVIVLYEIRAILLFYSDTAGQSSLHPSIIGITGITGIASMTLFAYCSLIKWYGNGWFRMFGRKGYKISTCVFCPTCGAENEAGSTFCVGCGVKLEQVEQTNTKVKV